MNTNQSGRLVLLNENSFADFAGILIAALIEMDALPSEDRTSVWLLERMQRLANEGIEIGQRDAINTSVEIMIDTVCRAFSNNRGK